MFEKEVARGAKWLDKNRPGWLGVIMLKKLNLGQCDMCMLGQLYGGYNCDIVGDLESTVEHGFSLGLDYWCGYNDIKNYKKLTTAWKTLIRKRRKMTPSTSTAKKEK